MITLMLCATLCAIALMFAGGLIYHVGRTGKMPAVELPAFMRRAPAPAENNHQETQRPPPNRIGAGM